MAKQDIPPGYRYNPKTRGATEIATGAAISRRQVEKLRIARETGTSGSFEAKSAKNKLMAAQPSVRLPIRRKVYYRGQELTGQARYVVHDMASVVGVISVLPKGAEVYVKALIEDVRRDSRYLAKQKKRKWVWIVLSETFRASGILKEYPVMLHTLEQFKQTSPLDGSQFFRVKAFEIIVKRIAP